MEADIGLRAVKNGGVGTLGMTQEQDAGRHGGLDFFGRATLDRVSLGTKFSVFSFQFSVSAERRDPASDLLKTEN